MLTKLYKQIARELSEKYYHYYCTVYFDFIVEAVENAISDIHTYNLEKLHNHIKENYI